MSSNANLIVIRHKPDWLNFDLEDSRAFLRAVGIAEDLVIEFARLWDRNFKIEYRQIRAAMQLIALSTLNKVVNASVNTASIFREMPQSVERIAFVDDDDWFSLQTFSALPPFKDGEDGVRWGNLRLGRSFCSSPSTSSFLEHRPLDNVVYTNNYAISHSSIDRFGLGCFYEHTAAQKTFDSADFSLAQSSLYLSCAVKHPCCTLSAHYLMSQGSFRRDPRHEIVAFVEEAKSCDLPASAGWLTNPLAQVCRLFEAAL